MILVACFFLSPLQLAEARYRYYFSSGSCCITVWAINFASSVPAKLCYVTMCFSLADSNVKSA